ncbi:MAG TPA: Hpt domain-containing protein [Baekduia sp.]|nr:Hpt domain-containing protein [Baekduia sp.]
MSGALDEATVAALERDLGPDGVRAIARTMLDAAPADVRTLADAAEQGDADAAARAAHRLRSGCLMLGARALADACAALEAAGKAGAPGEELAQAAGRVAAAWEPARAALEQCAAGSA